MEHHCGKKGSVTIEGGAPWDRYYNVLTICQSITSRKIENEHSELDKILQLCIETNGHHFEHLQPMQLVQIS
ncbi:hypothetical protein M0804_002380 [Polistes exclamans]|nr:hypothetical protein M0804_002380 [Polistes exclamans]